MMPRNMITAQTQHSLGGHDMKSVHHLNKLLDYVCTCMEWVGIWKQQESTALDGVLGLGGQAMPMVGISYLDLEHNGWEAPVIWMGILTSLLAFWLA